MSAEEVEVRAADINKYLLGLRNADLSYSYSPFQVQGDVAPRIQSEEVTLKFQMSEAQARAYERFTETYAGQWAATASRTADAINSMTGVMSKLNTLGQGFPYGVPQPRKIPNRRIWSDRPRWKGDYHE